MRLFDRNLIDDFQAESMERGEMFRVVGEEFQPSQAEVAEDLNTDAVVTAIHGVGEVRHVDVAGGAVYSLQEIDEGVAVVFWSQVNECAAALVSNHAKRRSELLA